MKLIVVIVQDTDANALIKALSQERLEVTKLASTGGFLREGNTTMLIGVSEEQVQTVKDLVQKTCRARKRLVMPTAPVAEQPEPLLSEPVEVPVGGAIAFVVNIEETFKV